MIFLLSCLVLGLYLYWINRKLFQSNGPFRRNFTLPLIGNGYIFFCKDEDVLNRFGYLIKSAKGDYYKPVIFWLGSTRFIVFTDPHKFEKIFSSWKFANKSVFYDVLKRHGGEGLITSEAGPSYKKQKKAIVPLLEVNFNHKCYEIFEEKLNLYMEDMKKHCTGKYFNFCDGALKDCIMGFVSKVVLGVDFDPKRDHQFKEDNDLFYVIVSKKFFRPWLKFEFIFKMTSLYKEEAGLILRNTDFLNKAIDKSKKRINSKTITENEMEPIIDQLARIVQEKPDLMDETEFYNHIFTLLLASYDPTYITISFCCLMLGMYPECQKKLVEELRDYFGPVPRNATLEDVAHLPYLDMCVKETLRIQAIGPVISRRTIEDCEFDNYTIPKNSQLLIAAFYVHRDPKFWENPDHFHPDHFLPENVAKRPLHAYLPFSAGIRGCIGEMFWHETSKTVCNIHWKNCESENVETENKIGYLHNNNQLDCRLLANAYIRVFLASFLQKFEVEADGKLPDLKFVMDISAKSKEGYKVKIKERLWK